MDETKQLVVKRGRTRRVVSLALCSAITAHSLLTSCALSRGTFQADAKVAEVPEAPRWPELEALRRAVESEEFGLARDELLGFIEDGLEGALDRVDSAESLQLRYELVKIASQVVAPRAEAGLWSSIHGTLQATRKHDDLELLDARYRWGSAVQSSGGIREGRELIESAYDVYSKQLPPDDLTRLNATRGLAAALL
ncbi:MAG: hypothetical protein AAGG01_22275, partial [Planctomycetota bacterium]